MNAVSAIPSLFERRGIHPMRDVARKWCCANSGFAQTLPGWSVDVLRAVLGEELVPQEPASATPEGAEQMP